MLERSGIIRKEEDVAPMTDHRFAEVDEGDLLGEAPVPLKNPHAAALGRLGGQRGGPARALKLSAERRTEIARLAAQARWHAADRQDQQEL
jgi:hypothetical protein